MAGICHVDWIIDNGEPIRTLSYYMKTVTQPDIRPCLQAIIVFK
jgi:hypothetical protein